MPSARLRLHHFLPSSWSNGPGNRAVLWLQGCTLGCPGCFNPETHSPGGGLLQSVEPIWQRIQCLLPTIEGVTISGGEPLQQRGPLLDLLRRIRHSELSVLLFTGYSWRELQAMPDIEELLACLDVLIAGRYDETQRLARDLRGSANKTVHFLTGRYSANDLALVPEAEVIIDVDGQILLTGIDPVSW